MVISIIVLLLGILVPALGKVRTMAKNRKTESIIAMLSTACKLYYDDLDIYPPSKPGQTAGYTGSEWITEALTGYMTGQSTWGGGNVGDREEKWGFRTVARGTIYGPYNDTHKLTMSNENNRHEFLDAFKQPIMYYRFIEGGGYVAGHNPNGPPNVNAYARGPDGYYRKDFIIISRGYDGKWTAPYSNGNWDRDSDDIGNILEE